MSISLRKVSNTSNDQAEITRNIPMKIALKLPKSLGLLAAFTQKLLVILIPKIVEATKSLFAHTATLCAGCSTVTVRNDRLSQPATQERRRRCHCLTALSITRWSSWAFTFEIMYFFLRNFKVVLLFFSNFFPAVKLYDDPSLLRCLHTGVSWRVIG